MNILIAEPLAAAGVELLRAQPGWNIIVSNPKEYAQHLAEADALLVRSAVQVTAAGAGESARAACHRPRRRGRGQRGSGRRHRGRRAGDEHARRQRRFRRRARPGADARHGAPHSPGRTPRRAPASGRRRSSWATSCAAKRSASSAWAASAAKWSSAPAPSKCASWRTIPTSPRKIAQDLGVELVDLADASTPPAITSPSTWPLTPGNRRACSRAPPSPK